MSFWVFAHIITDAQLYEAIRLETAKACSSDGSIDVEVLLKACPRLTAVWHEVLRLYSSAAVARKATLETTISGVSIHAGDTLLGPFRQFHLDANIFGSDAREFDAGRFFTDENLQHRKGYHPFGGGNTYCPGRFFARAEIFVFVAVVLERFDVSVAPGQSLPEVDLKIPSSTAMTAKNDLLLIIRPREIKR